MDLIFTIYNSSNCFRFFTSTYCRVSYYITLRYLHRLLTYSQALFNVDVRVFLFVFVDMCVFFVHNTVYKSLWRLNKITTVHIACTEKTKNNNKNIHCM